MKEGEGMYAEKGEIIYPLVDKTALITVKDILATAVLLAVFAVIFWLSGCAQMQKCDMVGKPTAYASEKHLLYSWGGYKNTDIDDVVDAYNQKWWGCPVFYFPNPGPTDGQGK